MNKRLILMFCSTHLKVNNQLTLLVRHLLKANSAVRYRILRFQFMNELNNRGLIISCIVKTGLCGIKLHSGSVKPKTENKQHNYICDKITIGLHNGFLPIFFFTCDRVIKVHK